MEKSVSVIIVNYNGGPLLAECVGSVLESTVPVEVFVSDNASTDSSLIELRLLLGSDPRLRVFENPTNLGFAKANNRALPFTKSEFILFLNPDCIVGPETLARMLELFDKDPEIGMAGCLIRNPDGTEQPGCRRNIPTPWRTFVQITGLDRFQNVDARFRSYLHVGLPVPETAEPIEAISGAFMFIRRQALDEVGPMDEGYFMHFEDLDWCLRFQQHGWRVIFEPRVEIVHVGGVCTASRPIGVEYHKHKGMARFYRKYFRNRNNLLLYLVLMPGILARFLMRILMQLSASAGIYRPREPRQQAMIMAQEFSSAHQRKFFHNKDSRRIVVTGATSLIGDYLLPALTNRGNEVHAISRNPPTYGKESGLIWHGADISRETPEPIRGADILIHLAPLATLPSILETLGHDAPKRVMGFGSTSLFTKAKSALEQERDLVRGLSDAEARVAEFGNKHGVEWTVFRPTLVYHLGRDKNITTIAVFLKKFGFFPLVDGARGKRQPVHAEDLACATLDAMDNPKTYRKAYNLSGAETLPYREMVTRIAESLGLRPRMINIPLPVLQFFIVLVSRIPRFKHLNTEMATRISIDMCFDNQDARSDFGFSPRTFLEAEPRAQTPAQLG